MHRLFMLICLLAAPFVVIGCDRDVAEIETPAGEEYEVERDMTTGNLEVEED